MSEHSSDESDDDYIQPSEDEKTECDIEILPKGLPDIQIAYEPKIKHNSPLYRDGWISMMLCGRSGCGKTSLMGWLIPGISDQIRTVVIATQVYNNPFHNAIKQWCENTKRICVINNDPVRIREFIQGFHKLGALIPGKQEMMVIFDDFAINNRSGRKPETLVVEAFTRWRNLGVHVCVICQDATMVATSCRNCIGVRVLFASDNNARKNFNKNVVDLVPDQDAYMNLMKYIMSVPYSYVLVRDHPFDVSIGKGRNIRTVMDEHSVIVPTYNELMSEIGVPTGRDLTRKTASMQKEIGNTAPELDDHEESNGSDQDIP